MFGIGLMAQIAPDFPELANRATPSVFKPRGDRPQGLLPVGQRFPFAKSVSSILGRWNYLIVSRLLHHQIQKVALS